MKSLLLLSLLSVGVVAQNLPAWEDVRSTQNVGWRVCRDQSVGLAGNPPGSGTGCFYSFQSFNSAGLLGDWALLNGGLVDKTAGKEQGDIDFITVVDGKTSGFAIQGRYAGWGAALVPIIDNQLDLGRPTARWKSLMISGAIFVSSAKCPAILPKLLKQRTCIQFIVDGVPVVVPAF